MTKETELSELLEEMIDSGAEVVQKLINEQRFDEAAKLIGAVKKLVMPKRRDNPSPVPAVVFVFGDVMAVKVSSGSTPEKGDAHGFEFYSPPPSESYWWRNYDIDDFEFVERVEVKEGDSFIIERSGFDKNPIVHYHGGVAMCEFGREYEGAKVLSVEL